MTGNDFIKHALDSLETQLTSCYNEISEVEMDHKITPDAMSPREIAAHLCEVYQAFSTEAAGGKHEWGNYDAGDRSTSIIIEKMFSMRKNVVDLALQSSDEATVKHAIDYIVLHDPYHVGQICLARIACNKEFNPYSIYGS